MATLSAGTGTALVEFPASLTGQSAAQNGPVIQTCTQCGAVNDVDAERCVFCDALFSVPEVEASAVYGVPQRPAPVEGNLAVEPEWRREVSHRLEAYRERRQRLRTGDAQPALPPAGGRNLASAAGWNEPAIALPEDEKRGFAAERQYAMAVGSLQRHVAPPARAVGPLEIAVYQPELDFAHAGEPISLPHPHAATGSDAQLLPVASLAERRGAGLLDAAFLLVCYAGFLGMFRALGGVLSFGKLDALVYAATAVLFYAQYFALFTVFGAATPGMLLRGLRVVSFDGTAPAPRQLLWRSFGYLLSGGTALLGFFWALWDEDHLTWQDRISQTYVTHAQEPEASKAARAGHAP